VRVTAAVTIALQESAKDAYYIVNDLFASRDFDTLAPMVSEKLLEAFRCSRKYKVLGLRLTSH
jgi:hypothetical protein